MLQKIKQSLLKTGCLIIGHSPEARVRFTEDGAIEGYWQCSRCLKELNDDD